MIVRYHELPMLHDALRILMAAVLATCSPAWCACALAAASHDAHVIALNEHQAAAPAAAVHDCCRSEACAPENTPNEDPCGEDDSCACCVGVPEFGTARDVASLMPLDVLTAPLADVIACVAVLPDDARAGPTADRETADPGGRQELSLFGQRCLLLI